MPKIALADTLREWESLLAAAEERGAGIPRLAEQLAQLRAVVERTRALEALRQHLDAERQKATADLEAARAEGKDLAIGIRGRLVATFGPRWAGLTQFGIRLRQGRRPKGATRKPSPSSSDASGSSV